MKTWTIEFTHNPPLTQGAANTSDWEMSKRRVVPKPKELSFFVQNTEEERYVKDIARALDESGDFGLVRVYKEVDKEAVDYS